MKVYFISIVVLLQFAASAQNGTEIILFDVTSGSTGINLSAPVNITNHKGYDNQPFFDKAALYYSSVSDSGQMDIKKYDYKSGVTSFITNTPENEFSPTLTPDGFISCILQRKNGNQDLVKYPGKGGKAIVIIEHLKVGYHAWGDKDKLVLFVLEDTNRNALHYYNIKTKEDKMIAVDIGRSLHRIPGQRAISYIQKKQGEWLIQKFDMVSNDITKLATTLPGQEYLTWSKSGAILMSDGNDIYYNFPANKKGWQKVQVSADIPLKNITRLAFNDDNTKLAVVISE